MTNDKSLKLGLFLGAALLTGCPGGDNGKNTGETDTVGEDPCDADPSLEGCPCEREAETGLGQFYFVGGFEFPAGQYDSAYFGIGMRQPNMGDWLCELTGPMANAGDAPAGCPDCTWTFTSEAVSGSTGTGDLCADFGLDDGAIDGQWGDGYGWGWADQYALEYGSGVYYYDSAIMLYLPAYPDYGWFKFSGNYPDVVTWTYGDSESSTFARPAFNSGNYVYYYYYTGEYSYDPEGCTYVE